jgi:tetratricopeptide (TPR) repeat protein
MKAEHRHELKTNELAEWLTNLPQWAKENLRIIIYVSIVAVVVIASALFHWYRKNVESAQKQTMLTNIINNLSQGKLQILQGRTQGVDISYMLIQNADDLKAAAQNTKDNRMAAFALIKRAEALRTELHYRLATPNQQEIATQMDKAQSAYAEAFDKASADPSLRAAAKLGTGLCEEERGNFETAQNIYRHIAETPDFEGTVAAAAAKQRLATMADYKEKAVFRQAPKPAQQPIGPIQPQIPLKPVDVNSGPQIPNNVSGNSLPSQ